MDGSGVLLPEPAALEPDGEMLKEAMDDAVARLAALPRLNYAKQRKMEAQALGVRATDLDAAVGEARAHTGEVEAPEPEEPAPRMNAAEVALAIADLAGRPPLDYQLNRKAEAARLGLNVRELDAQVGAIHRADRAAELDSMERPDGVPRGFVLRPDGVYAVRDTGDADLFVCGPLQVAAQVDDGAGLRHGRLLRWTDGQGRPHQWAMPMALLAGDGVALRERLLDEGLLLGDTPAARAELGRYLQAAQPPARAVVASRMGWRAGPGGAVFVLPGGAIGPDGADPVLLQAEGDLPPLVVAGTLQDWHARVARPAEGNTRLVFALSCAFAAALLGPLEAEAGGFHIRGGSSIGKTGCLDLAGSVWGGGGVRGWKRTWRATANALEGVARMHTDLLLCLDEMGEALPEDVEAAAYMLANGAPKARAAREGGLRRAEDWRVLFLSSGEVSLADRLLDARGGPRRARAGQEVRVVDVPADAGRGLGVFELLPVGEDAQTFAKTLGAAIRACHGTAGPAFLRALVNDLDRAVQQARTLAAQFVADYVPADAAGQVRRVADRFALVAAAGELAAHLGVVPWPKEEAMDAAAACFDAWRAARPGGNGAGEDAAALAAVRHFIGAHGSSRFQSLVQHEGASAWRTDAPDRPVPNRAGWRKSDGDGSRYLILPETWRREVCTGLDAGAVARVLETAGHLVGGNGRPDRMERVGEPKPVRVYVVRGSILGGTDAP